MGTTRRQFLTAAIGAAAAVPLLPRWSMAAMGLRAAGLAPRSDRILLLVDLAGGNDGLNTVVPYGHDRYRQLRPGIGLAKTQLLALNEQIGLRQEMRGLKELHDRGRLAIVQGVGYPSPDRSHFRSADIWHSASLEPEKTPTGWIGRLCGCEGIASPARTPALMVGNDKVPLILVGEQGPAPQLDRLDALALPTGPADDGANARAEAMRELAKEGDAKAGTPVEFLRTTARAAQESAAPIERAAARGKVSGAYPATALGGSLKIAAQLVLGGLDCSAYYVRQQGYDTHAFQEPVHGLLLQELSDSLAAFWKDVEAGGASKRVVVLVWSEFGRRASENGSKGTDHGAAAPVFVLGESIRPGLIGAHPSLEERDLDEEKDVQFTTDFRSIYAALLEDWIGVPSKRVLGGEFQKAPLFRREV
jgi:uncharacterized protein (DUF1501 family)